MYIAKNVAKTVIFARKNQKTREMMNFIYCVLITVAALSRTKLGSFFYERLFFSLVVLH